MGLKESGLRGSLRNVSVGIDAIPDSEADEKLLHRWVLDDVNDSVEDSIGDQDGTVSNVSSIEGDFAGGAAADGSSNAEIDIGEIQNWIGDLTDGGGSIAFTVDNLTDGETQYRLLGDASGSSDAYVRLNTDEDNDNQEDGNLVFFLRDEAGDDLTVGFDNVNIADGDPHRIVINVIDPAANDIEAYADQVDDTAIGRSDGPNDFSDISNFKLFQWGGVENPTFEDVIDDVCIFDESLTEAEATSYNNPWD